MSARLTTTTGWIAQAGQSVLWMAALACYATVSFAYEPNVTELVVHSRALEANLLGDKADRRVTVYLPPGYADTNQRYPVIYLLHGYTGSNRLWTGEEDEYLGKTIHIDKIADTLISQRKIQPMIIVAPDCCNTYRGSFYTNSSVTGRWEDFLAKDLVAFIDRKFRTLRDAKSRGIAGHSMGGFGAITIGVKNHDTFSAIFAMAPVPLDFREETLSVHRRSAGLENHEDFEKSEWVIQAGVAQAAAFSPNPDRPPFLVDFPCDAQGRALPAVVNRWKEHDPCQLIRSHANSLAQQRLCIDCGLDDPLITQNRHFVEALHAARIPHVYEEYAGDHTNRIASRLATEVFPFFSRVLAEQ